jgi:UDP-MurNAc hydroxylase
MRFAVIGHACLYIDAGGKSILVDPWLFGSCYWRSWWHFPPNTRITEELLDPDCIYLSHHHFDHFHYPSLRRLNKDARVFIPRFGVDIMLDELHTLGFKNITEMPHGEVLTLPGGARAASYQYGQDDSAFVIEHGGVVLADLNDCKIMGAAGKPILKAFGPPTFLFKSHSFAQAYPNCYRFEDPAEGHLVDREDFIETFIESVRELTPRYAVPFASMVAFLHPESRRCNQYAIRPPEVVAAANATGLRTETVLMAPGDSWDSTTGFSTSDTDYYSDLDTSIERMAAEVAPKLADEAREEAGKKLEFDSARDYFRTFLRSLPFALRLLLRRPVVFYVPSSVDPYWVVDPAKKDLYKSATLPSVYGSLIKVAEGVLADAIEKRVVNFIHISMRTTIEVKRGGMRTDLLFWGLLTIYELGYFPLRHSLTGRSIRVAVRRHTEFTSIARRVLSFRSLSESLVGTQMKKRASTGGF